MVNVLDDSRFGLVPSGQFRERRGPVGRGAAFSNKKLCLVATDPSFLIDLLYGLSLRADCYHVKYATVARDGMYLGRCFLATDEAVSQLCQELKSHPRLMVSLQDDAWFNDFRAEPVAANSCGVWDDWLEHEAEVSAVIEAAFGRADEARLVAAIRAAGAATVSLTAQVPPLDRVRDEWPIIGHVLLSPVTIAGASEPRVLGLGPLAVAPAHQRKGAGARLVEAGLARARLLGYAGVVVVGSPEYYSRFGFVAAEHFGLVYEGAPAAYFQALELVPGAALTMSGVVRYHPAFEALAP
jgi:putative acetyltransferase